MLHLIYQIYIFLVKGVFFQFVNLFCCLFLFVRYTHGFYASVVSRFCVIALWLSSDSDLQDFVSFTKSTAVFESKVWAKGMLVFR